MMRRMLIGACVEEIVVDCDISFAVVAGSQVAVELYVWLQIVEMMLATALSK